LKQVRVFGGSKISSAVQEMIDDELTEAGLKAAPAGVTETGEICDGETGQDFPGGIRAASRALQSEGSVLEFWRPREGRLRAWVRRLLARGPLVRLGVAAGGGFCCCAV
jgi:hypothetical protein